MKKYFIKKTHAPYTLTYLILYMLFILLFVYSAAKNKTFPVKYIVFLCSTLLFFIPMYILDRQGLYIENDKLYYKVWRKHKIDLKKVTGLKIIVAESLSYANIYMPIHGKGKNHMFSIIAVSEIDESMKHYADGDMHFCQEFKKKIIFQSIYDEKLFIYLKNKIPDLIILPICFPYVSK